MPIQGSTLQRVVGVYGPGLTSYVLNITPRELTTLYSSKLKRQERLSDLHRTTLRSLWRVSSQASKTWVRDKSQRKHRHEALTRWIPREGTTWANALRLRHGGQLPAVDSHSDDVFAQLFFTLLGDVYPALLAHHDDGALDCSLLFRLAQRHPRRGDFSRRAATEELSTICSVAARGNTLRWSTGHEMSYPADGVFDALLTATVELLVFRTWALTWDGLARCALEVLAQARQANDEGSCTAFIIAGIGDITMTDSNPAIVLQPRVTAASASGEGTSVTLSVPSRQVLPPTLDTSPLAERGVTAQLSWLERVQWTEVPGEGIGPLRNPTSRPEEAPGRRARQQVLDLVRLGISQVGTSQNYGRSGSWDQRVPVLLTQRLLLPLGIQGMVEILPDFAVNLFTESPGRPPGRGHERGLQISQQELPQLVRACQDLLALMGVPAMSNAVRRLAAAQGLRETPTDQLVDLAICVESMFGGGEPGTKYKPRANDTAKALSLAAASPLGSPEGDQQVAQKLFDLRNLVVHGRSDHAEAVNLDRDIEQLLPFAFNLVHRALPRIALDERLRTCPTSYQRREITLATTSAPTAAR